jgi:hypothetical protein
LNGFANLLVVGSPGFLLATGASPNCGDFEAWNLLGSEGGADSYLNSATPKVLVLKVLVLKVLVLKVLVLKVLVLKVFKQEGKIICKMQQSLHKALGAGKRV